MKQIAEIGMRVGSQSRKVQYFRADGAVYVHQLEFSVAMAELSRLEGALAHSEAALNAALRLVATLEERDSYEDETCAVDFQVNLEGGQA